MPADGRARAIFIDQRHGEGAWIDAVPIRNSSAHGHQKRWNRSGGCTIVRLAEECDSSPRDDPAHLEGRKLDIGNRLEEHLLVDLRDEVLAIVEALGPIAFEEVSGSRYRRDLARAASLVARRISSRLPALSTTSYTRSSPLTNGSTRAGFVVVNTN